MNAVHRGLIALVVPCLLIGSTHPEGASLDIYHIERYRVHVIGEHFAIDGLIDGLIDVAFFNIHIIYCFVLSFLKN